MTVRWCLCCFRCIRRSFEERMSEWAQRKSKWSVQSLNRVRISWEKSTQPCLKMAIKEKSVQFLDKIRVGIHSVDFLLSLKRTHLPSAGQISVISCPKATTPFYIMGTGYTRFPYVSRRYGNQGPVS